MERELKPQVGVAIICIRGGKVLIGRRGPASKRGKGLHCIPGGALEYGESIMDCALRELKEETGLTLQGYTCVNFTEVPRLADTGEHWITFYVVGIPEADQEPELCEPGKCDGWEWMSWEDLPSLELYEPLARLVKTGWEPF